MQQGLHVHMHQYMNSHMYMYNTYVRDVYYITYNHHIYHIHIM